MLCQGGDWSGEHKFIFKRSMISAGWSWGGGGGGEGPRHIITVLGLTTNIDHTG